MGNLDGELPCYILERLSQVIRDTGYRVVVEEAELLEFDSEVRYASRDLPFHYIRVSRDYADHRGHFILSSLEKIRRFFAARPEDRFLPVIDVDGRLSREEEGDLQRRNPELPRELVERVSNQLYVGLTRQLLSFPLDLRVESDLLGVPEHRELQQAYLRQQMLDLDEHFSPQIEAFSPAGTYARSSAMNVALVEFCSRATGLRPGGAVRYSRHREAGLQLLGVLDGILESGHIGDRRAQRGWARDLGCEGIFSWGPANTN